MGKAQSEQDVRTLKEILHTYEKREEQLNPVWIRFHTTYWESRAWRAILARGEEPQEARWTVEGDFARKGVKRRSWSQKGRPSPTGEWDAEQFFIYNGEAEISRIFKQEVYTITKAPQSLYVSEPPFRIAGEHQLLSDLSYWSTGKPVHISVVPEVGEERCMRLEVRYPNGAHNKFWLLPGKGWSIRRREAYNEQNGPMNFSDIKETGVFQGIPYPKTGRRENYMNTGALGATVEFEVDLFETCAAHIPDSLFLVDIPKTADVYDGDLHVTVRNTEVQESHLKEVVARAAGRGGWGWWLWAGVGIFVLALAGSAAWFYRRRMGFGAKRP